MPSVAAAPPRHWSLAWPLTLAFMVMVVYASLYPFTDWREQGIEPWAFLQAPWPRYWTGFDVTTNLLGYIPLGALWTLAGTRSGWGRWAALTGIWVPSLLSLCLESLQMFLPQRVPSTVDWLLNTLGGVVGVLLTLLLLRWRLLGSWDQFQRRCLVRQAHGGVFLLLLWPLAALYPTPVPFGLGQFWVRLDRTLAEQLAGTPFLDWLPRPDVFGPLSWLMQAVLVALCVWAPLLLAYALVQQRRHRVWGLLAWVVLVLAHGSLSAALTYGPQHAWDWFTPPTLLGMGLALLLAVVSLPWSHRSCALWSLMAWGFALGVLNRAPEAAYFAESLGQWEQGRFIRFHGLSQWLGWLWPYAALWVGSRLVLRRA